MNIQEQFNRQRRNLLVISIIVLLINFAGINISEINLSGVKINIEEPVMIYIFSWIMLVYFLVRYIQYFFKINEELKDYGFIEHSWETSYYEAENFVNNFFHSNRFFFITIGIIIFLFSNSLNILFVFSKSLVDINFTETLLPILFAIFVIVASMYTEHYMKMEPLFIKSKNEFFAKFNEEFIIEPRIKIEKTINNYIGLKIFDEI